MGFGAHLPHTRTCHFPMTRAFVRHMPPPSHVIELLCKTGSRTPESTPACMCKRSTEQGPSTKQAILDKMFGVLQEVQKSPKTLHKLSAVWLPGGACMGWGTTATHKPTPLSKDSCIRMLRAPPHQKKVNQLIKSEGNPQTRATLRGEPTNEGNPHTFLTPTMRRSHPKPALLGERAVPPLLHGGTE